MMLSRSHREKASQQSFPSRFRTLITEEGVHIVTDTEEEGMPPSLWKWCLVLTLLGVEGRPLFAATVPPNYHDLLRGWYARYLGRPIEPQALKYWGEKMVREKNPAIVQADILASGEYYQRHGSTPVGFIRALFRDELGREPQPRELDRWLAEYESTTRRDRFVEVFIRVERPTSPVRTGVQKAGAVAGAVTGWLIKGIIEGLLEEDEEDDLADPHRFNRQTPPPPPPSGSPSRAKSTSGPVLGPRDRVAEPLKLGQVQPPR